MPHEEPTVHDTPAQNTVAQAQETAVYEASEERDEWLDEAAELPRRPHRRLLTPVPLMLLGVLLIACGFIGGVLVEKGQTSSSSSAGSAASLASRFAALRGGTSGTGTRSGTTSTGGAAGASSGSSAGFNRPIAGQVAYLSGDTLYVTSAEGNTVKVTSSAATSVSKTVKATVKGIHPGETVTVTGATAANGAVSAESISVGSGDGGLAALFGGSGRSGAGGSGAAGGAAALFGSG